MAFTHKSSKFSKAAKKSSPAPKTVASYARKKREEEIEVEEDEVEEIEVEETENQEVSDDYDEQEEAQESQEGRRSSAPAPRRGFTRPAPQSAPRRSFGGQGQGQGSGNGGREQQKALRLTGLFAGKREGCYSGKLRTEDSANLAALIEEAQATGQQIVFFVWENQGNPQFSLTANISVPFKKEFGGNGGYNRGGNGGFRKRW